MLSTPVRLPRYASSSLVGVPNQALGSESSYPTLQRMMLIPRR